MDDRRPRTAIIQQYGIAGMADEIVRLRDEIDRLRKVPDDMLERWTPTDWAMFSPREAVEVVARRMGGTQPEEPA